MVYGASQKLRRVSYQMSYIGIDPSGVQAWQATLNAAHEAVIEALNRYRTIAEQNNEVAKGAHFERLNGECENITNKHLQEHTQLHEEYNQASNKLVQGIFDVAGH
jgi:hypothetical protein